ncbi:MAG TPA: hypothetical protein VMU13_00425 [Candidatus Paceibacterota bacterium]|nr:hypothetical protein [Candidatus Paceibacterota bacterium]
MQRHLVTLSWIYCILAILAWSGVGLFVTTIQTLGNDRLSQAQLNAQQSLQSAHVVNQHDMLMSAASETGQLDTLGVIDPASFAHMITTAASTTGVNITIENASQGSVTVVDSHTSVQSFTFSVATQGSFALVMKAAQLLESLPAPSSISQLEFTHVPAISGSPSSVASWQMTAQVLFLSVSNASS